jgi:hypothetical protein
MLEMQQVPDTFRGNYQTKAGRMNSPLHGCLIRVGANSFALAAAQNDNRGNIEKPLLVPMRRVGTQGGMRRIQLPNHAGGIY